MLVQFGCFEGTTRGPPPILVPLSPKRRAGHPASPSPPVRLRVRGSPLAPRRCRRPGARCPGPGPGRGCRTWVRRLAFLCGKTRGNPRFCLVLKHGPVSDFWGGTRASPAFGGFYIFLSLFLWDNVKGPKPFWIWRGSPNLRHQIQER